MSAIVRDLSSGYPLSDDYEALWKVAQECSVVCVVDYRFSWDDEDEEPSRDVCHTLWDGQALSASARGICYVGPAETFEKFERGAKRNSLKWIVPKARLSLPEIQNEAWEWFCSQPFAEVDACVNVAKMAEELGEIARLEVRIAENRLYLDDETRAEIGAEAADLFLSMLQLLSRRRIDFEAALIEKWAEVRERDYRNREES